MRDLKTNPLWRAEDLGQPIPESPHACSVALPLWSQVVGYEEEDPAILERLQCGYPRFFWNKTVDRLFETCREQFAEDEEQCFVFPSQRAAERCAAYLFDKAGANSHLHGFGQLDLVSVCFPEDAWATAKEYWRYSGEIVTSRQAEAALADRAPAAQSSARDDIKQRLADISGQRPEDVFLFPSGMSAVFSVHRMLCSLFPDRKCAQLEFPYVDVLRVQRAFGGGVFFYPQAESSDVQQVTRLMQRKPLSGVFCELASNPLMRSADVETLAPVTREHEVPLIVDDTIATSINIDAFQVADVVTTSLTKYFSGTGDVMGGSVIVRHDSPFHDAFTTFLRDEVAYDLWDGDAVVLEANSRDYPERMKQINQSAEAVHDFLIAHPKVEQVFYPKSVTAQNYHQLTRPGAGYGGLISIVLRNAADQAPKVYDRLRISKGPSLGTNFSLVCPYTLLAHYHELDWAASCGVSRNLIRISIGLESPDDLIARFDEALA